MLFFRLFIVLLFYSGVNLLLVMSQNIESLCILKNVCNGKKGTLRVVKRAGIETLISCAKDRGDKEAEIVLKNILNSSGDPVVEPHKSCYSTYISREK